jgi:hypothetical protein
MIVKSIGRAIGKCGQSRYEISKATGIDQAILCRIVNGGSCGMRTADKLCKYLGLELRPRQAKGR